MFIETAAARHSAIKGVLASGVAAPALLLGQPLEMTGAYANTLTRLLPDLYAALNYISRELIGFLPGVNRNTGVERAAVGQSVVWPVAPQANLVAIAPAMQVSEPADQVIGNGAIALTQAFAAEFGWNGEEQRGLNTGPGYLTINQQQMAQAFRKLANQIESDVSGGLYIAASRAYGTPGTTPFATDMSASAGVKKILLDNGADPSAQSLVIDTTAGANMRNLLNLTRVNEAGSQMTLRDGELLPLHGFSIRESAAVKFHVKGTGANYTTSGTALDVGTTSIPLITGTGTVKAGDVVTFAGDTNKYVVKTGVAAPGTIVLNEPGLRVAIPAAATAMTIGNSYSANVAYAASSFGFAARPPAMPAEGDLRLDSFLVTDQRSGLTFEVSVWPGSRKVKYEIALVWGWAPINSEGIALLMG